MMSDAEAQWIGLDEREAAAAVRRAKRAAAAAEFARAAEETAHLKADTEEEEARRAAAEAEAAEDAGAAADAGGNAADGDAAVADEDDAAAAVGGDRPPLAEEAAAGSSGIDTGGGIEGGPPPFQPWIPKAAALERAACAEVASLCGAFLVAGSRHTHDLGPSRCAFRTVEVLDWESGGRTAERDAARAFGLEAAADGPSPAAGMAPARTLLAEATELIDGAVSPFHTVCLVDAPDRAVSFDEIPPLPPGARGAAAQAHGDRHASALSCLSAVASGCVETDAPDEETWLAEGAAPGAGQDWDSGDEIAEFEAAEAARRAAEEAERVAEEERVAAEVAAKKAAKAAKKKGKKKKAAAEEDPGPPPPAMEQSETPWGRGEPVARARATGAAAALALRARETTVEAARKRTDPALVATVRDLLFGLRVFSYQR